MGNASGLCSSRYSHLRAAGIYLLPMPSTAACSVVLFPTYIHLGSLSHIYRQQRSYLHLPPVFHTSLSSSTKACLLTHLLIVDDHSPTHSTLTLHATSHQLQIIYIPTTQHNHHAQHHIRLPAKEGLFSVRRQEEAKTPACLGHGASHHYFQRQLRCSRQSSAQKGN